MVVKITAKEVRTMLATADVQASSGAKGACMVMRYHPNTRVTCKEITKAACDIVDRELGNDGHAHFVGPGTKCLS